MPERYDVIVAGLGAMGSAAAFHLARRGARVIGFDRFAPPHAWGSTPGGTRIIREAYFEHPQYVPLIQRAYECWDELQRSSTTPLLVTTGGLMVGHPDGVLVSGARRSAQEYRLAYDELSAPAIRERFPAFRPASWMGGIWEPRAGFLYPDRCIAAHLELARRAGATVHVDEPIDRWTCESDGVFVQTQRGDYRADRLVLTCGAWLPELLGEVGASLHVERTVQHWFRPATNGDAFAPERCPIYLFEYAPPSFLFYGFPDIGEGVKVARHHQGVVTTPDQLNRTVGEQEVEGMRHLLVDYLPDANGPHLASLVCMYTNTPDHDFVIDFHPDTRRVIVASPCSGHGFKFSSVIGEVLADLATHERSEFDLRPFSLRRFV